jgi:hypothetical protein
MTKPAGMNRRKASTSHWQMKVSSGDFDIFLMR